MTRRSTRTAIWLLGRWRRHLPAGGNGKLDLNNAGTQQLADRLRDPLQRAGVSLSDPQVNDLAAAILASRDKEHNGLLASVDQLKTVPGVTPQVLTV